MQRASTVLFSRNGKKQYKNVRFKDYGDLASELAQIDLFGKLTILLHEFRLDSIKLGSKIV